MKTADIGAIPTEVKRDILERLDSVVKYARQEYGLFAHFVNITYEGAYSPPQCKLSVDVTDETGLRHELLRGNCKMEDYVCTN